jgi:uncharacterized protein (TIGR00255 family)
VRSMTGYGAGEVGLGRGSLGVEARTVNHRALEVRVYLPPELGDAAMAVEQAARARLGRGRCEIVVRVWGEWAGEVRLDFGRARAAFADLVRLRDELSPGEPVPLGLLAAVPDLFARPSPGGDAEARAALDRALGAALDALDAARAREGRALAAELEARAGRLGPLVDAIEARRAEGGRALVARMRERVRALAADAGPALDPGRLELELALAAERGDVAEELARVRIHLAGFGELLGREGPVGRELDFLLQEMLREMNTLGSKSQDAAAARAAVGAKAEIERLREQVQNVE